MRNETKRSEQTKGNINEHNNFYPKGNGMWNEAQRGVFVNKFKPSKSSCTASR